MAEGFLSKSTRRSRASVKIRAWGATSAFLLGACTSPDGVGGASSTMSGNASSNGQGPVSTSVNYGDSGGSGCSATHITYGDTWIPEPNHATNSDIIDPWVKWDGVCSDDGANSYATISNGLVRRFTGHGGCVMDLTTQFFETSCTAPANVGTNVVYGAGWIAPAGHVGGPSDFFSGRVMWNRECVNVGASSYARLSNGITVEFAGNDACNLSFSYQNCGGLYENPVLPTDCPNPSVVARSTTPYHYWLVCASNGAPSFPMREADDLVHWTSDADLVPYSTPPAWVTGQYRSLQVHDFPSHGLYDLYVAHFSALAQNGRAAIGAARAACPGLMPDAGSCPEGPYQEIGQPLVSDPSRDLSDPTAFEDATGNHYLAWRASTGAPGQPPAIFAQQLASDGLSLVGAPVQLITADQAWEGQNVESPSVYLKGSAFFLFYGGSDSSGSNYALGVARSASPLGPYSKLGTPILTGDAAWAAPGHATVIATNSGDTMMIYVARQTVGGGSNRLLVDQVQWDTGWPTVREAPSFHSRPMP